MAKKIPPEAITAWVQQYFPDHRSRRNGAELVICNPLDGDSDYKFNINPQKG